MSLELNKIIPSLVSYSRKKISPCILITLLIALVLVLTFTSGCTSQERSTNKQTNDTLVVACTIPPQEEFIRAVGGDDILVLVMVPQGASPHTFEPAPSQIAGLESADLYLSVGSGIEFENRWLDRIRAMYPDLPLYNTSENITLMAGEEDYPDGSAREPSNNMTTTDPHAWLSVKNAIGMVQTTCSALSDRKPEKREQFEKNRDDYITRLIILDSRIRTTLSDLPSRKILVYHPAFGYFCRDYGLTQISIEENGKEPSAKNLASIIDQARRDHIACILTEPEVSSLGAETLASEINATVILVSPLSASYLENMQTIADHIAGKSR